MLVKCGVLFLFFRLFHWIIAKQLEKASVFLAIFRYCGYYTTAAWHDCTKEEEEEGEKNLLEEGGIYDFINVLFFRFVVARAFNILRVKLRANVWWNEISQTGMYKKQKTLPNAIAE